LSKGPGRWQRIILAELSERDCFYLLELLPANYRKAEYNALNRAAWQLAEQRKIDLYRYMCGMRKVLCVRHGGRAAKRPEFNRNRRKV
jgi:hypothetical protein